MRISLSGSAFKINSHHFKFFCTKLFTVINIINGTWSLLWYNFIFICFILRCYHIYICRPAIHVMLLAGNNITIKNNRFQAC